MFYYFILLISFQLIASNLSLKTKDLCLASSQNCETNNGDCKCEGKYSYQCIQNYCAVDKTACDGFYYLNSLSKSYKGLKVHETFKRSPLYDRNMQKYILFVKSIQNCLEEPNEMEICSRGLNCFVKQEIQISGSKNVNLLKSVGCPCVDGYKFNCGDNYCTVNKQVCDDIQNRTLIKTAKCGNDNVLVNKK